MHAVLGDELVARGRHRVLHRTADPLVPGRRRAGLRRRQPLPGVSGTWSEDFFNGGYYFEQGPFSQPVTGNTAHVVTATNDKTARSGSFCRTRSGSGVAWW